MFLKKLELYGFKSFADKIELSFVPSITAIVGPNGSGKSNLADAIRWVLGEQSVKSLRGAKMEDVIFAGSDKRKALSIAEVSLTLDNSDQTLPLAFSEVTVARRIYRSGESEYLINKVPCRLKDIQELFMDTGIARESYTVIGQGKIDEILSTKPEDRRAFFEEAARITKFKYRKREALRKLEETSQNLLRIEDLIFELERQREPLEEAASRTRLYQQYHHELCSLEINFLVDEMRTWQEQWKTAKQELEKHQDLVAKWITQVASGEVEVENARVALAKLDEEYASMQQALFELSNQYERACSRLEVLVEKKSNLEAEQLRLEKEIAVQQEKLNGLDQQREEIEGKEAELRGLSTLYLARLRAKEEELECLSCGLEEILIEQEQYKTEIIDLLNRLAHERNEISRLKTAQENLQKSMHKLEGEQNRFRDEYKAVNAQLEEVKRLFDETKKRQACLEAAKTRAGSALTDKLREVQEAKKYCQQVQNNLYTYSSRLKVLEEMERNYDGYYKGVKAVLLAKDREKLDPHGLCGVVAELISVPKQYELAVEVALGGALQYIVTENEEYAKQAITYLKEKRMGRATFLPLTTVQPQELRPEEKQVCGLPGVLGTGAELVKFEDKYRNVVEHLLGRIIITTDLETAMRVAHLMRFKLKVVTLEGDIFNPGGSMTGGSYGGKSSSILSRNREVRELKQKIAIFEQRLADYNKRVETLEQEAGEIEQEIKRLQQEIQDAQVKTVGLEKDRDQLQNERIRLEEALNLVEREKKQYQEESRTIEGKSIELARELTVLENTEKALQEKLFHSQQAAKEKQHLREQLSAEITDLKIEIASIKHEESSVEQKLKQLGLEKEELTANIRMRQQEITEIKKKHQEIEELIETSQELIVRLQTEKQAKEGGLEKLRADRQDKYQTVVVREKEIRQKQKHLQISQQQLSLAQTQVARLESEVNNARRRILEAVGEEQDLEKLVLETPAIIDQEAASQRIRELKVNIEALGPINHNAIEELNCLKERYAFLKHQHEDLTQGKMSLLNLIGEMDEIMKKQFLDTFFAIRDAFKQMFQQLFNGGQAELVLTNQEDLLETGIEIIAQPPGKKLQNLLLLSGGERALTAIALLFAVLMIRPIPFCVLDEIEASLDEANVQRFADLVRKFSSQTQFIIVTHRKGTMEAADVLYGVTMEESGVSKLVSVKLVDKVS